MFRVLCACCAAAALLLSGCTSDGGDRPADTPTSVQAFPDLPHFEGSLEVALAPALREVSSGGCTADAQRACSPDGDDSFRLVNETHDATVAEVVTAPSADHTSWTTTVRFDAASRPSLRDARERAAGFGGVVLVIVDDEVVDVANPQEIQGKRIERLGLEKAEAWAIVDTFAGV